MKVLLGATAAVFLLASPALAQQEQTLASCQNFPAAPAVPDGASADRDDLQEARDAVSAWDADMQTRIAACRAEITALNEAVNAQDTARAATINSMATEIQEFTARASNGEAGENRRERGGVRTRSDY